MEEKMISLKLKRSDVLDIYAAVLTKANYYKDELKEIELDSYYDLDLRQEVEESYDKWHMLSEMLAHNLYCE